MRSQPRVSIVIPVYNGADYLGAAIDSALDQTYANTEVIVVNDGSCDGGHTERIAKSYGERIRYFSKQNGGVASALNLAVSEMTGDYFSWLSHDDLYVREKVEREVEALSVIGRDNVVVYSDYSVFTGDPSRASPVRLMGVSPEKFRYWITVENKLHGCTLLIPRNAFEEIGLFDERLRTTQDYDLWFRMAKKFSFVHLPEILVKARNHPAQGSNAMAGIALVECNSLLLGFVQGLSHQEIVSATAKSLGASYAEIAASMFGRGFNEVGDYVERYILDNGIVEGGRIFMVKRKLKYLESKCKAIGRKILPAKIKLMLKAIVKPGRGQVFSGVEGRGYQLKNKFSEIYEKNIFGGHVSRSGEGSDLVQTAVIRQELPRIIKEFSVGTILDAPCGDWYWMKEVDLGVEQYIGVDIVGSMIERNKAEFERNGVTFQCVNLAEDPLPKVDLIFSRDCLVHLSFLDSIKIIQNFKKSGAKYLLTTTFVDRDNNNDLVGKDGFWRPLNMRLAPFNFPEPLLTINEGCTEELGQYKDKCISLWLLSDIRL